MVVDKNTRHTYQVKTLGFRPATVEGIVNETLSHPIVALFSLKAAVDAQNMTRSNEAESDSSHVMPSVISSGLPIRFIGCMADTVG